MDAMDILGSLLGKKRNSGGLGSAIGGKILKDLLGGGSKKTAPRQPVPQRAPSPPPRQAERPIPRSRRRGSSLEDLLRKADDHYSQRGSRREPAPPRQSAPQRHPAPPSRSTRVDEDAFDDEAEVLVRAMVNAAKADGRIDKQEQDSIIGQLGQLEQDQIDYLRQEFSTPLDVREFAWSVPLGYEENVYTISLLVIDLDANVEAQYLHDLAHGLRMDPEDCNRIHDKLNAPRIFR